MFPNDEDANVDMSPKAITDRLRLVSQLTAVCLALGQARPIRADPIVEPSSPPKK